MKELIFWSAAGLAVLVVVGLTVRTSINGNAKRHAYKPKIAPDAAPAFEYRLFPVAGTGQGEGA